MKFLTTLLLLLIGCGLLQAQETSIALNSNKLSSGNYDISIAQKEMIVSRCQSILKRYNQYSQFTSNAYLFEFEQLFDTNFEVQLYNDLEFNPNTIEMGISDYLRIADESFVPNGGLQVRLEKAILINFKKTLDGNYMIEIELEKYVEKKLNEDGEFVYSGNGFVNDLTFFIEIDPIEDSELGVKIVRLIGSSQETEEAEKSKKIKAENDILLSFGLLASKGMLQNQGSVLQNPYLGNSNQSSFGGFVQYRRSIGDKFYLTLGARGEVFNITTKINDFNANVYEEFESNGTIESYYLDLEEFPDSDFTKEEVITDLIPTSYANAQEELNLINIQSTIGIDYIVSEGFLLNKFLLGLNIFANYLSSSGDGIITGEFSGLNLPQAYNFPDQEVLLNNFDQNLPVEYTSSSNSDNQDIRPQSNLSYGIGLTAHKVHSITRTIGIVAALEFQYGLGSTFDNTPATSDPQIPLSGFILDKNFSNRNQSLLEDHFAKNSMIRGLFKVGMIIQL